jgi:PepSY-associated transmembrane protein/peptidase YpeB-like protein
MRRVHRIATLVVGVPLLVWTATGFAFTWFDFAAVRGVGDRVTPAPLTAADVRVPLGDALAKVGGAAKSIELRAVGGRPTWILDGKRIDAVDGRLGAPLGAEAAAAIARAAHRASPSPTKVDWVTSARQAPDLDVPVWRVRLDDGRGSEVYVSPSSGAVVAWRNNAWRRFDALWSLHVFGFVSRDNPAHLPLRIAGGLALLVAASGAWILVGMLVRRRRLV